MMSSKLKSNDFSEIIALCNDIIKKNDKTIDLNVLINEKTREKKIKKTEYEKKQANAHHKWYEKNKEKAKISNAEYKETHKEQIKRQKQLYYLKRKAEAGGII